MSPPDTSPLAGAWGWSLRRSPILNAFRWAYHRTHPQTRASRRLDAADLPAPVTEAVRAIVARTRLHSRERDEVCRELLAHAEDAVHAGATPESFAASLGDPKPAARLIRRAVKRKRSTLYHARVWVTRAGAATLGVLLLIYTILLVRFYTGSPQIKTDYLAQMNQHVRSVPETDRFYPVFAEIDDEWNAVRDRFHAMQKDLATTIPAGEPIPPGVFDRFPALDESHPHYGDALRAVREFRPHIDRLRVASRRPHLGMVYSHNIPGEDTQNTRTSPDSNPWDDWLVGVLLPHLGQMRQHARLLAADARLAIDEGDAQRIEANLAAIAHLARLASQDDFLISDLVAIALLHLSTSELSRVLVDHPGLLDQDQLLALAHTISACARSVNTVDFQGEIDMFQDTLQRAFTDDGQGDGRLTPEGLQGYIMIGGAFRNFNNDQDPSVSTNPAVLLAGPVTMQLIASRKELSDLHARFTNAARTALQTGPQALAELETMELQLDRLSALEEARYLPITALLPAYTKSVQSVFQSRLRADVALTAIALEIHRLDHDTYPSTLADLTPHYLPDVPPDPFDPGQPLKYRLTDAGPILYAVGADGDDDGGRPVSTIEPESRRKNHIEDFGMRFPPEDKAHHLIPDADWILYPPEPED
ncbi:MAG: hypothetical protein ACF8Q5_07635 [Phycisphaerales bacterium JB040]